MLGEAEFTEGEYNKLKRKVDWILLPLVSPRLRCQKDKLDHLRRCGGCTVFSSPVSWPLSWHTLLLNSIFFR